MKSSTLNLRTLWFLAFLLTSSFAWSDSFEDHLVYIKGSSLAARDVLDQVEDQVDVRLILRANDHLSYRKNYDDLVTVAQVLDALKSYYRDHMSIDLEIRPFGRHRYVIYSKSVMASNRVQSSGDLVAVEKPDVDHPQLIMSDLEFDDDSMIQMGGGLQGGSDLDSSLEHGRISVVDSEKVSARVPVEMELPRADHKFLNVEVIGRQAVSSTSSFVDTDLKPKSTIQPSNIFDLDDLAVAEEKFVAKENYLSWSERIERLFGSEGLASSDDGMLRSPVMVGMMKYRHIFSPVKLGLSVGFESSSLSSGSDLDVKIAEALIAYQYRTKDDFDLRVGLALAHEDSEIKLGAVRYRSRAYGLSALDFSMSKDVYAVSDFTGRMALKFKVPLAIGAKGLMGGTGLDVGLSTGLGYDALDAFWSVQLDLNHYSDHDRLGGTKSLVPSISWSCERELTKFTSWSFGGVWGESPFQTFNDAWLSDDQLMFYVGVRSLSRQLPLTMHLYVGASESSPDVGLTITWFPNIKTSL